MTPNPIHPAFTMSTSGTCDLSGDRLRVFVVDHQEVIARTLAIILRQAGYDTYPFYGATPALEAAQFAAPDLLLTDVGIPDLDGIELACRMTDQCPACKVLLFSGHATTASLLEDGRTSCRTFEVLGKPLHPNDLLAKVDLRVESGVRQQHRQGHRTHWN